MQINRINIFSVEHRPLLNGLEMLFDTNLNSNEVSTQCIIGVNGSGKSQLLETIAEIFLYLDETYRTVNSTTAPNAPLYFEIDYTVRKMNEGNLEYTFIRVNQSEKKKTPTFYIIDEFGDVIEEITSVKYIESILPERIVGYTSGANETLSFPFIEYYDDYAIYTGDRAKKYKSKNLPDYDPRLYLMDYDTNIGVVVSNLLFNIDTLEGVLSTIKIKDLKSFRIKIQLDNRKQIDTTVEMENWIKWLKSSATCYEYFEATKSYTLDFFNSNSTREAFRFYFESALNLYTCLYKFELLNSLIIPKRVKTNIRKQRREKGILIKPPTVPDLDKVLRFDAIKLVTYDNKKIDYINLSDGEHQFLNVFGSIAMTNFDNTLYLLDEPETHFNPKWRRKFINLLNDIAKGRHQSFIITSHSPFIVSDSRREQVYIFKRDSEGGLNIEQPKKEIYGSAFDYILKVAFDMDETVSQKSLSELRTLQKSDSVEEIEGKLDDFGESVEKFFLYNRIEQLKQEPTEE